MKKYILLVLLVGVAGTLVAQSAPCFFYVQLRDKSNTPFSLANPSEYLSARALQRRATMNIPIDSVDLPVNTLYLSQIQSAGAEVFALSKWLNGVTVRMADSTTVAAALRALPFVKYVEYTGLDLVTAVNPAPQHKFFAQSTDTDNDNDNETVYANAFQQINQLNGLFLHNKGYRAHNVHIAVIDAGFYNTENHIAFDSLRAEGRILGSKNFARPDLSVYDGHTHGTTVLSTMAANVPATFVGTAPDAAYWLLQSERNEGEYPVEADLWIAAAEFADSAGVDIITTSLSYATFNDASLNYTYADLDGNNIRASRAARLAAEKGILVFNAAGNEGQSAWHYIGVPADAQGIITVGAVDAQGAPADFSSFGYSADGRVKPDVCAMGQWTSYANAWSDTAFGVGNGTSFSSPVLAGVGACLLQALKENNINYTIPDVIATICQSASLYDDPTDKMGYGIPDFETVYKHYIPDEIVGNQTNTGNKDFEIVATENQFLLKFPTDFGQKTIRIYDVLGRKINEFTTNDNNFTINRNQLPKGLLLISVFQFQLKIKN